MKSLHLWFWGLALTVVPALRADSVVAGRLEQSALDYAERLRTANDQLAKTRDAIAREKAPMLAALRAAEDRIVVAQAEVTRLETQQEQSADQHRRLAKDAETLRKNENYLNALAHDSLTAFNEGLLPGEQILLPPRIQPLEAGFSDAGSLAGGGQAARVAEFLLAQTQQSLGGYFVPGQSLIEGDNRLIDGVFAVAGPETFFRATADGVAGTVRLREGTGHPVTYRLPDWKAAPAAEFFQGHLGTFMADASAGKALRLREAKGTVLQHINKGGVVSYAILCVGLLSLLLILQKVRDIAAMGVAEPAQVQACLEAIADGGPGAAGERVRALRESTRELLATGLRHAALPKRQLEEHLQAVLLRQRLHAERWLQLLAVIATAAPLMGLLGTVTGMVRTFALITVFGTGNAGKLASGISEVLVATELGLMVAIPTLIAHGFLAHRVHKNLALQERYAVEFLAATQTDPDPRCDESRETVPA